jgi:hypothetical protein
MELEECEDSRINNGASSASSLFNIAVLNMLLFVMEMEPWTIVVILYKQNCLVAAICL